MTRDPPGCFFALIGLSMWAYAGNCGYLIWLSLHPEDPAAEVQFRDDAAIVGSVCFVFGAFLVIGGSWHAVKYPDL